MTLTIKFYQDEAGNDMMVSEINNHVGKQRIWNEYDIGMEVYHFLKSYIHLRNPHDYQGIKVLTEKN